MIVHKVIGKRGDKAKQGYYCVERVFIAKGSTDRTGLVLTVGDAISLDYCPKEVFIIAEIDAYDTLTRQKYGTACCNALC